jgi:hypothetical protein
MQQIGNVMHKRSNLNFSRFTPPCPHCSGRGNIRSSRNVSDTFAELFCICSYCGMSWKAAVEVLKILNPPLRYDNGIPIVGAGSRARRRLEKAQKKQPTSELQKSLFVH